MCSPLDRHVARWLRVFVLLVTWSYSDTTFGEVVVVSVPSTAHVQEDLVQLIDIARVTGGSPARRRQIAHLDIAERSRQDDTEQLTREQIELRVRLAGIPSHEFAVTGARRLTLSWESREIDDQAVLGVMRPKFAERLHVTPEDIQLRLTRPLSALDMADVQGTTVLEPFLPANVRPGPLSLRVGVYRDGQLLRNLVVYLEVRVFRRVFVANRALASGDQIDANDVVRERRALAGREDSEFAVEVIGQTLRRPLRSGEVIVRSALTRKPASQGVVVRPRDLVVVTARKRGLEVSLLDAEVVQAGRVGDTIRVKNPKTNHIITARVVDASNVEVRLR